MLELFLLGARSLALFGGAGSHPLFLLLDDSYWEEPLDKKPRNHYPIRHIVDKPQVVIAKELLLIRALRSPI